jgi:anti-sigma regulatory factor (Ser/Thr protein kinase)
VVRLAVSSLGRAAGLSEEAVDDLKIAASEACANAVLGAAEDGSTERVVVGWSEESDRIVVTVFDPSNAAVQAADTPDSQGFDTRRMMSEALLQSLVDEVAVRERPGGGSETRLEVSRPPI